MKNEVANGSTISLEQYKAMLEEFDWLYEYSDDQRIWRYGLEKQKALWAIAIKHGPEYIDAYFNAQNKHNPSTIESFEDW